MDRTIGIIIILISAVWSWYHGEMVHDDFIYGDESIYCFRPAPWISSTNFSLELTGISMGIFLLLKRMKTTFGLLIPLVIMILGILLDNFGDLV
ncbi:hypothetical protein [Flexithrix dorotheae]|uniref:hypothetical protein n=1 Tax=Flexithrix dorotheae TaxID=70993 RepID=UPI000372B54E|nr:hypothetical protein [Flexithrix dorotheae]